MESIRAQGRVLLALMLREARTRYGRRRAGYAWALIEPLFHIAAFTFFFSLIGRAAPIGDNLITFMASGFLPFLMFRNVKSRVSGAYGSNEALLSFPVINVTDVFIGRALLDLATSTVVVALVIGTLVALGLAPVPTDILTMLLAFVSICVMAFGIGTILGVVIVFVPSVAAANRVISRLLYFTSGVFYLPDTLPLAAREVLAWNPVLHGIEWFRTGFFYYMNSEILDLSYLAMWVLGSLLAALFASRACRKKIRSLA